MTAILGVKFKIPKDGKIASCLNDKWEAFLERIKLFETRDYSVYTGTSGVGLLRLLRNPDKQNLEVVSMYLTVFKP